METVNQEKTVNEGNNTEKTFTQNEVNSIVEERLARAKSQYSDYDALKEKAAKYDELEEANKSELQKANEMNVALKNELDSLKKANEIRDIRQKVSEETGVPITLLTGDSAEACTEQAKAILEYSKKSGYPTVKDGGEVSKINKTSTREQFAEWAKEAFN